MPDGPHDDPEFDAFASSLDEMLERVSSSTRAEQEARDEGWPASAERRSRPRAEPVATPTLAAMRSTTSTSVPPQLRASSLIDVTSPGRRSLGWGVAALVALGGVFAWTGLRFDASPEAQLALENMPPPAAGTVLTAPALHAPVPAASEPSIRVERTSLPAIASDPDASTEGVMLEQLRRGSAANDANVAPPFAIVRYDSLPAAARGWNVLVPLGVEEVYVLVPASSSLRDMDDLRGRRINVGASGSPRARSADALYRTLFGSPLPSAALRTAPKDVALPALLRGEGLDAMLLFDGQPSSWLAALPVETRLQLKVLKFDPTRSSGQRVLQSYLLTRVKPSLVNEAAPVPTLGEVTFLVASHAQASSHDLVRRLCERLPTLRASGHPKWLDVDPTLQLPVQLPRPPEIASALQACGTPRSSSTPS